jgi:hypothetical protein
MRAFRVVASAFALSGALFSCSAFSSEDLTLLSYYDGETLSFCFVVPMTHVMQLPEWTGQGTPPLHPYDASEVGAKTLRSEFPEIDRFEAFRSDVHLVVVNQPRFSADVWYYLVEYKAVVGSEKRYATEYVSVVLLDGTAVPKRKESCRGVNRE